MGVPEFQSKRVKKRPISGLSSTRYQYLSLDQAEPDLGDPLVGPSSIGAKPYPPGDAYILASFGGGDNDPSRYWVSPSSLTGLGLGLVPGALTIRDEGLLVGAANSFTILNFVGFGVTVDFVGAASTQQTGIATIRVSTASSGTTGQFQMAGADGFIAAVPNFRYDSTSGNVGFGTTVFSEKLHIVGNVRADKFVSRTDLISGTPTLLPGEAIDIYNQFGRIRSGYINVNRIDCQDPTGLSSSTIDTLAAVRFRTTFSNVTGVSTVSNLNVTVLNSTNANISGITTISNEHVGFSTIGLATITTLRSTNQVFSGITTAFEIDNSIARIGFASIVNSILGVATITSGIMTNATIGVATISNLNLTRSVVGFSSIGVATVGFTSITNAIIGVATVGTLIADNVSLQGTGSFSNISIGNTLTAVSVAATNIRVFNRLGIKTDPQYELDVVGGTRLSGVIYTINGRGNSGEVLTSQGANPAIWAPASNVTVGAANSVSFTNAGNNQLYNIAFTSAVDDIGFALIDNGNLTYNPSTNRLGIGNTIPTFNVDVVGDINFTGILYQNGDRYVASNWGKNFVTEDIYKLDANVGIGTSILSSNFTVGGTSEFRGNILVGSAYSVGLGSTAPRALLDVGGQSRFTGTVNLESAVTEKTDGSFSELFAPSSGTLTINAASSTVAVGILTESVSTWEFTGISTEVGKSTTITLIIDSSSLITYGELCTVNGSPVTGGVRWPGGIAPSPTNNEDMVSFAIVRDTAGTVRVYGSSSLNLS
jgi:hypothetical protein